MRLRFLWPGKTKNPEFRGLLGFYETRIRSLATVEIIETREALGLEEKHVGRSNPSARLEKYLDGA
jgi:hypothetical protein